MSKYSIETVREIWDDENGYCFEVGPDRDGLDAVEIRSKDDKGNTDIRIVFIPEMADLVADAMRLCAQELRKKTK